MQKNILYNQKQNIIAKLKKNNCTQYFTDMQLSYIFICVLIANHDCKVRLKIIELKNNEKFCLQISSYNIYLCMRYLYLTSFISSL